MTILAGNVTHHVAVLKKAEFLSRLMFELAGHAQMSLEGDLSRCRFTNDVMVTNDETATLKRNTVAPRQDFLVLRLRPETYAPILKEIRAAGLKSAIIHVQIERDGVLELGAYDNFHDECVVTGPGVSAVLLEELKRTRVLRDFKAATSSK